MKLITANKSNFDGNWYINISHSGNNKTVADGGEGYVSKSNAVRAIKNNWKDGYTFKRLAETATSISFHMVPRCQ